MRNYGLLFEIGVPRMQLEPNQILRLICSNLCLGVGGKMAFIFFVLFGYSFVCFVFYCPKTAYEVYCFFCFFSPRLVGCNLFLRDVFQYSGKLFFNYFLKLHANVGIKMSHQRFCPPAISLHNSRTQTGTGTTRLTRPV